MSPNRDKMTSAARLLCSWTKLISSCSAISSSMAPTRAHDLRHVSCAKLSAKKVSSVETAIVCAVVFIFDFFIFAGFNRAV